VDGLHDQEFVVLRCSEGAKPATMVMFRQQSELILCQYSIFKCSAAYDRNIQKSRIGHYDTENEISGSLRGGCMVSQVNAK
jgi:hypothetical protein